MKTRKELEIRMSEIREKVNAPDEPENMAELRAEYVKLEGQWRELVNAEVEAERRADESGDADEGETTDTPEDAEIRRLSERAEFRAYLAAAAIDGEVKGVEAELNAALELRSVAGIIVPWEALAPTEVEERADVATSAPTALARSQAPIVQRVFATGIASFLGVSMPTVASGERQYIHISAGTDPEMKAKAAAVDAAAATFTPESFKPLRLTARYLFSIEDAAELAGMESALRMDLREAFREEMDTQVLTGDGDAPNVSGFLAAFASGGLADVANNSAVLANGKPSEVVTAESLIGTYASQVDGRYARSRSAIRVAIGAATYAKLVALVTGDVYVFDRFEGQTRVDALIPAAAANIQQAVVAKVGAPGYYAVAPVWQGFELLRDPYTNAAKGQVAITATALWNFGILRSEGFKRLKFKLA